MKKLFIYALVAILLITGIFVLTGCENNKNENTNIDDKPIEDNSGMPNTATVNSKTITLTMDSASNNKEYKIKFDSNTENNKMYFDKQFPTSAQIRNEKDNYMIDIQIDELDQSTYDITIAEEKKHPSFKEEKISSFDGYSYTDESSTGTTTAKVLIDGSNPEARIYVTMIIGFEDDSKANGLTTKDLYKSSNIQYIINSISSIEKNK